MRALDEGWQKGAGPEQVAELDAALARFALVVLRDLDLDVVEVPGAGGAGGTAAGALAVLGARTLTEIEPDVAVCLSEPPRLLTELGARAVS